MLRPLAWLLEQLMGPGLRWLLVPALIGGLLTAWHQMTLAREQARTAREAALVQQGRAQCISEYELAAARAQADAAEQRARLAATEAAASAAISQELQDHAATLDQQLAAVRAELAQAGTARDPQCLSERVRDLVRSHAKGR